MAKEITISSFLKEATQFPVFDVRSLAEFAKGHIPKAINLPLFSNEERAEVGTIYKQVSPEVAMLRGLEIIGPKMRKFVETVHEKTRQNKVLVHCWRGGKRSKSLAWLLGNAGYQTETLIGGYNAYRTHVLKQFKKQQLNLIVLGGKTGSGKTKILNALSRMGEQVIDLEGLANHKGSAFGFIGEAESPTVEQFENNLFAALNQLDLSKPIWVENESRRIGKVLIPDGFWRQLKAAPLINIELPFEIRLKVSLAQYSTENKEELKTAFYNIRKRLGGQRYNAALHYLALGNLSAAAKIALAYYDRQYEYMLEKNDASIIKYLNFDKDTPDQTALFLVNYVRQQTEFLNRLVSL